MLKRCIFRIGSLLCLAALLISLSACTMYNGNTSFEEKDGVSYLLSGYVKKCFVTDIIIPKGKTEWSITIPDKLDSGHVVEGIGGYTGTGVPTPCFIGVDGVDTEMIQDHDEYSQMLENGDFIDLTLTLNVGGNVRKMFFYDFAVWNEYDPYVYLKIIEETDSLSDAVGNELDASPRYIRIKVLFNVAENNEYFYSTDGVAFNKEQKTN
jgi:hypothetical protein